MKKKYINPQAVAVKIASQHLLAGSETLPGDREYGTGDGITLGARGYDFDDFDEFDEE